MSETRNPLENKRLLLEKYLRSTHAQSASAPGAISRRTQNGPAPLSSAQQQFWFLAQLHSELPLYHEGWVVQIPGPLNVVALEQSLNEIIHRHEAWRTSFPVIDGQPVQMIHPSLTLTLPLIDLQHLPAAEREAEVQRLGIEDTRQPLDLNNGPLLNAFLVRMGENEHRLCLTLHHIIYDAFSLTEAFLPELYTLYQAFSAGQPSPLPELPIQYADFAQWQQDYLQRPELAEHLAYWKQHLAGAPTELALPTDYSRPPVPNFDGGVEHCLLSKRLTEDLKAISHQEKASLYMSLVAALSNLLMRYTGEEDLLIGTVSAGRKRPDVQRLLGAFIDTLVLRTDGSGDPTFRTLLRRVREETLSTMAHDEFPFTTLVKELRPKRSLEQNSLFQVMLILEPPENILPSGWRLTHLGKVHPGTALYDLTLTFGVSPEGLNGYFAYNSTVFEPATIRRMIGHWQTLLEAIVAQPDQPLSTLPFLTEAERRQILVKWNATQADYPQDQCLHHLFEQQVQRHPEAVAAVYGDSQFTYQELNERSNRLAHYLRKLGVGPEVLVGLCVERSLDMVVSLLAILKAGGAYVPLDPSYPKERLAFMLLDSQVPVFLTQQHLLERLPEHEAQLVCVDTDWKTIAQESGTNPISGAKAENLAYVIYTSGSTGKPKGVLIPHRAVVNHNMAIIKHYELRPADRILQFASLSFDTAVEEIFPCWLSGATLVLRPADIGLTPTDLLRLTSEKQLSVLNLPTAYWHTWTYELAESNIPLPKTLRLVVVGSEQAISQRLMLWQQRVDKRVRWCNAYGPTEATITATIYDLVRDGEVQEITTVPIGRPIANTQVYVLDKHLQPVPIGVPGELYIGGAGLARGYLNRPELTAERFIPNPFSQEPGARLYKTGDLVRYRHDGNLEYVGRVDFQVKIRGFRIELGEIETILSQHPQVREAVVVAREDSIGEKRLVAYLVLAAADAPSTSNLRSFLKEHLPDYMIPAAFVVLDTLPLTPSGKVDRLALPASEESSTQRDEGYIAPRTLTEERLAEIWEESLGQKQVGINENFFELGGHSLLAARMLAQLNATFQVKLSLSSLFENPTIQELATSIEQHILAEIEMMSVEELQSLQKQS